MYDIYAEITQQSHKMQTNVNKVLRIEQMVQEVDNNADAVKS